jgi:peptide/nickel transport system permease protein
MVAARHALARHVLVTLPRAVGATMVGGIVLLALTAPWVATSAPSHRHRDHLLAPPMPIRIVAADGGWTWPFVYPLRSVSRLERGFAEDRAHPMPLRVFHDGRVLSVDDSVEGGGGLGPWLPLGADRLGRDEWARLVHGARLSLAVAAVAVAGAMLLGLAAGAAAGVIGGAFDAALMRVSEVVLVLPVLYVVLAARAVLPLVLDESAVFLLVTTVLAALGWPAIARGVRAIVATEATRDYAMAARAAGAGTLRLTWRHLLPATYGFLRAQALMLVPAAILAETTLSFVGLGFEADRPSWGTLLQEASDLRVMAEAPWLLSAAGVVVLLVLGINLLTLRSDQRQ